MIKYIKNPVAALVVATKGKPADCAIFILILWCLVNLLFAVVEQLIWGERFLHFLDVLITLMAIVWCWKCVPYSIGYNQSQKEHTETM